MKTKFFLCLLAVLIVSRSPYLMAQTKSCDLELKFNSPYNGQVIPVGDTAVVTFKLVNHGPDKILPEDTVFLFFNYYPNITYIPHDTILSGDSMVSIPYGYFMNDGSSPTADSVFICAHLINPQSSPFVDPSPANDTPNCNYFILDYLHGNGIGKTISEQGKLLTIYPNPVKNKTEAGLFSNHAGAGRLRIMDIYGRTIFTKEIYHYGKGLQKMIIDLSQCQSGLYYVNFSFGNKSQTCKLLKE